MIDVSDGLALDLHRLADASAVGFRLDDVPVAEGATLDEALGGGEDYELVFTLSPSALDGLSTSFGAAGLRPPVRIGTVVADRGRAHAGGTTAPSARLAAHRGVRPAGPVGLSPGLSCSRWARSADGSAW